jgi:hypothetical protein
MLGLIIAYLFGRRVERNYHASEEAAVVAQESRDYRPLYSYQPPPEREPADLPGGWGEHLERLQRIVDAGPHCPRCGKPSPPGGHALTSLSACLTDARCLGGQRCEQPGGIRR